MIIALSTKINGQFNFINYRNGYIITLKNDTLFGLINDDIGINNEYVCRFKTNSNSNVYKYYAKDIKSYKFTDGKLFIPKELFYKDEYKFVFLEVLLEGKINLYYFNKDSKMSFYIEKEDSLMIGLLQEDIPIKKSYLTFYTNYEGLKLNVYKETLASIFSNSDEILKQIKDVKYNKESLINITKAYILETCKDEKCITYEYQ